jgi:hypothetical protein
MELTTLRRVDLEEIKRAGKCWATYRGPHRRKKAARTAALCFTKCSPNFETTRFPRARTIRTKIRGATKWNDDDCLRRQQIIRQYCECGDALYLQRWLVTRKELSPRRARSMWRSHSSARLVVWGNAFRVSSHLPRAGAMHSLHGCRNIGGGRARR